MFGKCVRCDTRVVVWRRGRCPSSSGARGEGLWLGAAGRNCKPESPSRECCVPREDESRIITYGTQHEGCDQACTSIDCTSECYGGCDQACEAETCDLTCYEFCEVQQCESESCSLECYDSCDQSCASDSCKLNCYEGCTQECTGEPCNMFCYEDCTQICGAGVCRMDCEGGANLCEHFCADGSDPELCGNGIYSCGGACP